MADNNHTLEGIQTPNLEDTTYNPSKSSGRSLEGIQAPSLDDTYTPPTRKNIGLDDISAPTLSDTFTPANNIAQPQYQQYGQPQAHPQYQQYGQPQVAPAQAQPQYQQYGQPQAAPAQAQPQYQQYGQPQVAPAQAQPQYQQYGQPMAQQKSRLDDVQTPQLEDEPDTPARYVPKYADPDLESAKKQAADRAIKSSLASVPDSFDKEKSREAYREFMREKDSDMAKRGSRMVILLMVVGLMSGFVTILFGLSKCKESAPNAMRTFSGLYVVAGILIILASAIMLVRSKSTQKTASTIFTIITILHVLVGIFVMLAKEARGTAILMYIVVLVINLTICLTYGSNENIRKHYNGHEIM